MEFAAWSEAGCYGQKEKVFKGGHRDEASCEVARTLGVTVMTLHRWRKAQPAYEASQPPRTRGWRDRIAELQLENLRLRQLVTDLLLEKIRLEEAAEGSKIVPA
jgi:hypothetical protein